MAASNLRTPGEALDKSSSAVFNFKVLKRISPNLDKILATAGQAALYAFSLDTREWVARDIEGTFFLIENHGAPPLQFVILNQKGVNYFEDIGRGFRLETKSQNGKSFLFYKSTTGEVLGIYFFDASECPRIASLLSDLLQSNGFIDPEENSARDPQPVNTNSQQVKDRDERRGPSIDSGMRDLNNGSISGPAIPDNRLGKRHSESTPNKLPSSRLPDASPPSSSQPRSKSSNFGQTQFIKNFTAKSSGAIGKQLPQTPTPQTSRTAGLTPLNHAEVLEALKGLQTPGDLTGDQHKKKSEEFTGSILGLPSNQNTPVSVQNGNVRKGEGAASGPGPLGQQILKPDFFQNILAASKEQEFASSGFERGASGPKSAPENKKSEKAKEATPVKQPTNEQQRMRNFFLSSKSRASDTDGSSIPVETPSRPSESHVSTSKPNVHENVRAVIKELAESDTFIDAIVQQLAKKKLLLDQ